jgi:hypothetical protein
LVQLYHALAALVWKTTTNTTTKSFTTPLKKKKKKIVFPVSEFLNLTETEEEIITILLFKRKRNLKKNRCPVLVYALRNILLASPPHTHTNKNTTRHHLSWQKQN